MSSPLRLPRHRLSPGRFFLAGLMLCLLLVLPGGAAMAFCIQNDTDVSLHAQALDSSNFSADIAPGGSQCCEGSSCFPSGRAQTLIMVVTGYRPVSNDSHPGWQAECRGRVGARQRLTVDGSLDKIQCRVGN